ncbi:hypothetical protein HHK36_013809 [Tetracentron sinense]|uniref:SRP54-type proteins GTP-binding domain-containing protein n=1 Tax=Tetracentron sinense TaxID=13715 RepID=A0A834Z7Q9_TETSI|nr:hypothetical protein HHK36_013809 [Tetracentron sinense]
MAECTATPAPICKGDKFSEKDCPQNALEKKRMENIPHASVVRSLMYAQTCTRSDISFVVGMLGRYQSNPGMEHWKVAKKVLRYLKGRRHYMLTYRRIVLEMLEQLLIFTRGGLILWTCKELGNALKGSPIDTLIRSCLLEERSGAASFNYDAPGAAYTLKWTFHNDLGLIFVAVYQRILHLLYVDDLLSMVKHEFSQIYDPKRRAYNDFDDIFRQLQKEAEARAEEIKKSKQVMRPTNALGKKQGHAAIQKAGSEGGNTQKTSGSMKDGGDAKGRNLENGHSNGHRTGIKESFAGGVVTGKENEGSNGRAFDVNKLQKLRNKGAKKIDTVVSKAPKVEPKKKITKKNRVWDDSLPESKLDFTDPVDEKGDEYRPVVEADQGESMMDREEIISSESETDEDEEVGKDNKLNTKKHGWFSSMFQSFLQFPTFSIAGKANLEKSDLEPALKALKDRLMTKNVAEEIAEKLCESVAASLEGKKMASFTRISSTVQAAMEEALVRILTPKRSIDILRDVHAAKEQRKPYVVVFVGVNGVGKSTNLAKVKSTHFFYFNGFDLKGLPTDWMELCSNATLQVAYWLVQHEISVMMAACDTFRSGAVEQLRTHARRLQIPIFEKGYEKDPAIVAKEAIQEASRNGSDVVLVDTAGRMQDNEPLMRALSKLIYLNNPDLILFVGEALVGNDAVDQLSKFNQKLADLSTSPNTRLIDGILLTKFDTIDDKVGAALSMVYISGAPVMFVGCGQSYTDLKKLNVKSIVKTLLK